MLHHVLSKQCKVQNLISLRAAENCSELSADDFHSPQLLSILSRPSSEHGLHRIGFLQSDPSRCWSRKRMDQHGWSPSIDVLNRIKRYLVIQISFWRSAVTDCVCVSKHSDSSILIKLQLSHWFLPRTRTDLISCWILIFLFFFARVYSSVGAAAGGGGGARLSSPGVSSPRGPPEAAAGEPAEGEGGGSAEREGEAGGGAGERGAEGGGEPSAPGPPAALFCRHWFPPPPHPPPQVQRLQGRCELQERQLSALREELRRTTLGLEAFIVTTRHYCLKVSSWSSDTQDEQSSWFPMQDAAPIAFYAYSPNITSSDGDEML